MRSEGDYRIKQNGVWLDGDRIVLVDDGQRHDVEISLGTG
jgi:hypothetical protein